MKKKNLTKLVLNKSMISKFQLQQVKGGYYVVGSQLGGCQTREGCNSLPDFGDAIKDCDN